MPPRYKPIFIVQQKKIAIFISIFLKIYKPYFFVSNSHETIMNLPQLMVWERADFIKLKFFILCDGLKIEYENMFLLNCPSRD